MKKAIKLITAVLVCQAAGLLGSLFTAPAIPGWYATIQKPAFNPPNWIFAPVWTALFLLMGLALYLVWDKGFDRKESRIALLAFGVQLFLNMVWSLLFFGLQSPFLALVEIIFLWVAILLSIILFWRISRKAGMLLVPYIIWVSFAAFLNYSIWLLNV